MTTAVKIVAFDGDKPCQGPMGGPHTPKQNIFSGNLLQFATGGAIMRAATAETSAGAKN